MGLLRRGRRRLAKPFIYRLSRGLRLPSFSGAKFAQKSGLEVASSFTTFILQISAPSSCSHYPTLTVAETSDQAKRKHRPMKSSPRLFPLTSFLPNPYLAKGLHWALSLTTLLLCSTFSLGQTPVDSTQLESPWQSFVESQLQLELMTEEEAKEALALYDELKASPLDINSASAEDLRRIPLLSDYQIYQFVRYRTDHGAFHEYSELKLVPGWSTTLLRQLRSVLTCRPPSTETSWRSRSLYAQGEASLFYGRRTPPRSPKPLLGPSDALCLSWSYAIPQALSLFVAGEKDYGEPWHRPGHRGFDAYSAHAQLKRRGLELLLGDYRVSRGCGLLLGQGTFPLNFLALTPRLGDGVRPVRHMTESDYSRGLALSFSEASWRAGLFVSSRRIDAHRTAEGALTGLSETGLHTTQQAWEARHGAKTRLYGGWISYQLPHFTLALQGLHQDWGGAPLRTPPGSRRSALLHDLRGYTALSLSYQAQALRGHLRLSGELAKTSLRAWAFVHHLAYEQGLWGGVSVSLWHLAPDYWSYYGRAGTLALRTHDEEGGRLQVQLMPPLLLGPTRLYIEGYRSASRDEAGRRPSEGIVYGGTTSLRLGDHSELGLYYRARKKAGSEGGYRLKLQWSHTEGAWQTKCAFLYAHTGSTSGWAAVASLRWQASERLRLDFLTDYFDSPSWASRLYIQHPKLRGEYGSSLLYGRGLEIVMRVRYSPSRHWILEGRLEREAQRSGLRPSRSLGAVALIYRFW